METCAILEPEVVINTQSVKTMKAGGECGYDAGKKSHNEE
jgi:hypothetical protein